MDLASRYRIIQWVSVYIQQLSYLFCILRWKKYCVEMWCILFHFIHNQKKINATNCLLKIKGCWWPLFFPSVSDTRLPIENYINVQITNDGYMWWFYPVTLKSSCLLNVKYFPFDQQACPLEFGSWTYDGSMVRFSPLPPRIITMGRNLLCVIM